MPSSRALLLASVFALSACTPPPPGDDAPHAPSTCAPCVSTVDCGSAACVQLANDSVCANACRTDGDCASSEHCVALTSAEGLALSACLAQDGACGALGGAEHDGGAPAEGEVDAGAPAAGDCSAYAEPNETTDACLCARPGACAANGCFGGWVCDRAARRCVAPPPRCVVPADGGSSTPPDAGTSAAGWCGHLAGPDVAGAGCTCHHQGGCAANGCFGGWFCDGTSGHCVAPPASCEPADAGSPEPADAGSPEPADAGSPLPQGTIDARLGGTASRLRFAVVGDTRPGRVDDTAAYPTAIVTGIYAAIRQLQPAVDFVVTTGDYMFATPGRGQDVAQLKLYLQARSQVPAPLWAALGNHECTGATNGNCGPEAGHLTSNYTAFVDQMLRPIGESLPYYVRRVDDAAGRWTAKVVVVAPNAWGPVESAWFERQLAVPTTYTFVVHHEPAAATQAPGMADVNRIVKAHPVTLSIVGHTHTWAHQAGEVVVGNGGAPLTSQSGSIPYGYTLIERRSDGAIAVTAYNSQTGRAFQSFAVHADGSSAP